MVEWRQTLLIKNLNAISLLPNTKFEVMALTKKQEKNSLKISADKVELISKKDGISEQNQNQQHNAVKQAQGPNTKR